MGTKYNEWGGGYLLFMTYIVVIHGIIVPLCGMGDHDRNTLVALFLKCWDMGWSIFVNIHKALEFME